MNFFKKLSIIWKFLFQSIFISVALGLGIWIVFNNFFSSQIQSMIEKEMFDKLKIINKLVDNYQKKISGYRIFQKEIIKKMMLNDADSFYLTVDRLYKLSQNRKFSKRKAQEEAWKILSNKIIGKTGYIYIVNSKGDILFHPKKAVVGRNDVNNPDKRFRFSRFQVKNAQRDGQKAFTEYKWKNPNETKWRPKALAQIYFKKWDWIISISSYEIEFDDIIDPGFEEKFFKDLKEQILSIRLGQKGYPVILTSEDMVMKDIEGTVLETLKKGTIIMHTDARLENKFLQNIHKRLYNNIYNKDKGFISYSYKGKHKYIVFNHYRKLKWIVCVTGHADEYFSSYKKKLMQGILFIVALFLIINLILSFVFFYFSVIRVINKIKNKLSSIAKGNLDIKKTTVFSNDSIGRALKAIHDVINIMENIFLNILKSSKNISSSIEEVSQGNMELSDRTEKQAVALEELGSSIEEFSASVRSNATNTSKAARLSKEAKLSAENGGEVVYDAIETMQAVQESSYEIENIINMIEEIAFQTNLLALNASVEAARAGEHGRGFAVVALEIRNLAKNTTVFAKKINELIRNAVDKIDRGNHLVTQSGEALQEIIDTITDSTTLIEEVSVASEQQENGVEEINKAISQLQEINDHNSQLAEEVSSTGQNMVSKMNSLRELIAFFKINKQKKFNLDLKQDEKNKNSLKKEQTITDLFEEEQEPYINPNKKAQQPSENKIDTENQNLTKIIDTNEKLSLDSNEFEEF